MKLTNFEISETVRLFNDEMDKSFGGFAFCAGYLGSIVSDLLAELPEEKQAMYVKILYNTIEKFKRK